MIDFERYLHLMLDKGKYYSVFENILIYYIFKRYIKTFFFTHSNNYNIEICSCNELSLNNLIFSNLINFDFIVDYENKHLVTFFSRIILGETTNKNNKTNFQKYCEIKKKKKKIARYLAKWNVNLLKILHYYYMSENKSEKKFEKKTDKQINDFFHVFGTYIIALLHFENKIIKTKDKPLFLFLFLLLFTKKANEKKQDKKYIIIKKSQKQNISVSDEGETFYEYINNGYFQNIKYSSINKLVDNHLHHVYIFDDQYNTNIVENGKEQIKCDHVCGEKKKKKKKIIVLCKKSLLFLSKICLDYLKRINYKIYEKPHLVFTKENNDPLSFIRIKKENSLFSNYIPLISYIKNIKKSNIIFKILLLKIFHKDKFIKTVSRKIIDCPIFFKKYLTLFYFKFVYHNSEQINITNIPIFSQYFKILKSINKYKNIKPLSFQMCSEHSETNFYRLLYKYKIKDINKYANNNTKDKNEKYILFTITCAYICLILNNNYYNLYFLFIIILLKSGDSKLHDKINYFINQLIEIDPSNQYLWNVKNMLFYIYIQKCIKKYIYLTYIYEWKQNDMDIFLPQYFICTNNVKKDIKKGIVKKYSEIESFQNDSFDNINNYQRIQKGIWKKQKTYIKGKPIIKSLLFYKQSSHNRKHIIEKKCKNKKSEKNTLTYFNKKNFKYIKKNFNLFFKILEKKTYNYMAASHIFIFYNSFYFFPSKETMLLKNKIIPQNYKNILYKNIYYYAIHNSYLLFCIKNLYQDIIAYLRKIFFVIIRKNVFVYNCSFPIVQKECLYCTKKISNHINGYKDCTNRTNYANYTNRTNYANTESISYQDTKIKKKFKPYDTHLLSFSSSVDKKDNPLIQNYNIADLFYFSFCINCRNKFSHNTEKLKNALLFKKDQRENTHTCANKSPEYIHVKNIYFDFYLIKNGDNIKKDIIISTSLFLFKKISLFLKNYKNFSKNIIQLLSAYYGELWYLHFYANGLRSVLYCMRNCNLVFLELFYNLILPLLFWGKKNYTNINEEPHTYFSYQQAKNEIKKNKNLDKIIFNFFFKLDIHYNNQLKFFKKYYTNFRANFEGKKRQNKTHTIIKQINKIFKFYLSGDKPFYFYQGKKKKKKKKKWITTHFYISSVDMYNLHTDISTTILNAYKKMEKKKSEQKKYEQKFRQNITSQTKGYYSIFFKSIINLIYEHSLHIYRMFKKYDITENSISFYNNNEINNINFNNMNNINFNNMNNINFNNINNCSIGKYNNMIKCVKKNIFENNQFSYTTRNSILNNLVITYNEINNYKFDLKKSFPLFYKIYRDIYIFFKIMKKNNFTLFYVLKNYSYLSKKIIKKKIYFLKFLFSHYFILFLCEHKYVFYLLKKIYKMLKYVFFKK
ncbi:uncharacterized protein PY17X_0405500 [Plasmodium yoelii]|uniref:Uncharacterized protein n=1 Tax=Plasmodium yoelii TaxID=5861 RepID=A0A4V0KGH6_PLAYE|nr:uncharacterized protein PY17X_0405500 [Plasmodium yoelii]VTZ73212.1 conserved Plasmodium membrane protein, unknown function [Plasmodium yoelii]|eukprot:XP_724120.2 uncharacterized protein PY17X_0405500 [Plasmodium yoelii]